MDRIIELGEDDGPGDDANLSGNDESSGKGPRRLTVLEEIAYFADRGIFFFFYFFFFSFFFFFIFFIFFIFF